MIFQGGTKVVKFLVNYSKPRIQPFFAKNLIGKREISKSRVGQGPLLPSSNAHVGYYRKNGFAVASYYIIVVA